MVKAILIKPLDGQLEGTEREFEKSDFERLKRSGAVRAASDVLDDGPTVAEYVAGGYRAENYPPDGYASRSTAEEIAAAIAQQNAAVTPSTNVVPEAPAKAAPAPLNKMAPSVANKSTMVVDPVDQDGDGKKGGNAAATSKQ